MFKTQSFSNEIPDKFGFHF